MTTINPNVTDATPTEEQLSTWEKLIAEATPGPWAWETPMGESCPWIVQAGLEVFEWEPIATLGDCLEDGPSPRSKAFKRIQADARLIASAPTALASALAMVRELQAEVARKDEALQAVSDARFQKDGVFMDFGWNITKLNVARPLVLAALTNDKEGTDAR